MRKRELQRKYKSITALRFILLLTAALMVLQNTRSAKALETDVRIEAPETVNAGLTFNISIIAEGIPNQEGGLAGWQVVLRWDPNVIKCTEETMNYGCWSNHLGPFFDNPINNSAGCYTQALTLKSPATPIIGTCWLVNLTFSSAATAGVAGSYLEIEADNVRGLEYILFDKSGNYILHNFVNAQLNVQPLTRNLSIVDLAISSDSMCLGDVANINVAVRNNGDVAETFNVSVYVDTALIHTQIIFDLLPSRQTVITCSWNTADASVGSYLIEVYVSTIPGEICIEDNVRVEEIALVPEFGSPLVFYILLALLLVAIFLVAISKRIHKIARFFSTFVLVIICLLPALHDVYAASTFLNELGKDWTFLVYLDADNNLEAFGINDFLEMASVGSNTNVNVVVQMDRAEGYDRSYGNWTNCKRFYITKNLTPTEENALSDLGEVNMGDPKSFVDFAEWAISQYPASKYIAVLWDHGSGCIDGKTYDGKTRIAEDSVKGVCYDETDKDQLTVWELQSALEAITSDTGVRFDIIGFDACLMSMIEITYQIRNGPKIIVASEENEPGNGWPYDDILIHLVDSPQMPPENFASIIVQDYVTSYQNGDQGNSDDVTLSAFWVDEVASTVIPKVNAFAEFINQNLETYWQEIVDAVDNTENYGYPAYRDICDFACEVKKRISNIELQNVTIDLVAAIEGAIIDEAHGRNHPDSHGLSVYLPSSENGYYYNYENLDFAIESRWDEFLHSLFNYADEKESFFSIRYMPFDSDGDNYNDAVKLEMDVDTTGGTLNVTVYGYLIDSVDNMSYASMASWTIKGNLVEYGQLFPCLDVNGTARFYDVELFLYDEAGNYEDHIYRNNVAYLNPPLKVAKITIDSSKDEVQVGDEVTVMVRIVDVYALSGFDMRVEWNASLFGYVNHTIKAPIETFTDGVLYCPVSIIKDEKYENRAYCISLESESSASPFNGSGIAFEFVFRAKAEGVGEVRIVHSNLDCAYDWSIPHKTANFTLRILSSIKISNIILGRTVVGEGFPTEMSVTVVSKENFTANFLVILYLNETLGGITCVGGLTNASINIKFCLHTVGWAKGNYIVNALVVTSLGEAELSMLAEVSVLVTVAGDIDGNRSVDNSDLALLKASFATQESETLLNADINCDGYCNARDAVILGGNFGSHW